VDSGVPLAHLLSTLRHATLKFVVRIVNLLTARSPSGLPGAFARSSVEAVTSTGIERSRGDTDVAVFPAQICLKVRVAISSRAQLTA
jgi:hypothetical protein